MMSLPEDINPYLPRELRHPSQTLSGKLIGPKQSFTRPLTDMEKQTMLQTSQRDDDPVHKEQDHFDILEENLTKLFAKIIRTIIQKNRQYGESWKRRGGVGAFMMMARKWDRLESMVTNRKESGIDNMYDIFELLSSSSPGESNRDTLEDLIAYAALCLTHVPENPVG